MPHVGGVAGRDDHNLVPMVLHQLDQRGDGFLAEVAALAARRERVGFVDEQHPAQRPAKDCLRLGRGVPDVLADQITAVGLDQMTGA